MDDYIKAIEKEIQWHERNKERLNRTHAYHEGFIAGLRQVIILILKTEDSK